jgi:hypothetical protein
MNIDIVFTYKKCDNNLWIINKINFSVQTVLKFAQWINKIFIVTDDNTINFINNKVKIIITDKPTELYIHNIPDLSEVFLYNTCDMFFSNYISMDDIIKNNKLIMYNNFDINTIIKRSPEETNKLIFTTNILNDIYVQNEERKHNHMCMCLYSTTIKVVPINLIYNNHTKILRKSTLRFINYKYRNLIHNNMLNYMLFVINIGNIMNEYTVIDSNNYCMYHNFTTDYNINDNIFNINNSEYKIICYNNMNQTYKEPFEKLMNQILNN